MEIANIGSVGVQQILLWGWLQGDDNIGCDMKNICLTFYRIKYLCDILVKATHYQAVPV